MLKHLHRGLKLRGWLLCASLAAALLNPVFTASASEADAEQAYAAARQQVKAGQFTEALQQLRALQKNYPQFSNISGVKTRIAVLHEADFAGPELRTFLVALDARDAGDPDMALILLRELVDEHTASPLVDDAIYLMAYVQLMERYDYAAARARLSELRRTHPDTAYRDAADYLNAIALEQSGLTSEAVSQFVELRDRHTSISLPFGYRLARGNVMSRYWLERADRRLRLLEERHEKASELKSRNNAGENELLLGVSIGGLEVDLVLVPSALTKNTAWRDGQLGDTLPPDVGVFSGHVKGQSGSWARVVLTENDIRGVVSLGGVKYRLHPDNLIGSLDYYQPKHRAGKQVVLGGSQQELPMLLDTLPAPPLGESSIDSMRWKRNIERRSSNGEPTDMRVVPLSIVIDSQYNRYYHGEGMLHVLNGLNVADALYRTLGLTLRVDESLIIAKTSADPMNLGPTTLEKMLRNFRSYRQGKRTLFSDSALVYLFTGNPKTDITLGLAWIDTACRNDGYDVGVTTPSSFTEVLLTHEIGHSLGAQHDTDTSCSGIGGKLMAPRISAKTETEMTLCSQNSITQSIQRSCLIDAVDLALQVRLDGNTVALQVHNSDSSHTVNAKMVVEVDNEGGVSWPAECELLTPTSAQCSIAAIAPQTHYTVSIPFSSVVTPRLTAQVLSIGAIDPTPANNVVSLNTELTESPVDAVIANNDLISGDNLQVSAARRSGSVSWLWLTILTAVWCGLKGYRANQSRIRR